MRQLRSLDWNKVLFFDIETSRASNELTEEHPMFDAWEYKMRYAKEAETKNFSENLPQLYQDKAALYAEFGVITCISVGYISGDVLKVKSYYGTDEVEIIQSFFDALNGFQSAWGKVKLAGHAIKGFDVPYVMRRAIINGIRPHDLMDVSGLKPWECDWLLDSKDLWQGTSWISAPLIAIAGAFNLPNPKVDIAGHETSDAFFRGEVKRIAKYCERDVLTSCNILRVMAGQPVLEKEASELDQQDVPLLKRIYNLQRATKDEIEELRDLIESSDLDKKVVNEIITTVFRNNVPEQLKF